MCESFGSSRVVVVGGLRIRLTSSGALKKNAMVSYQFPCMQSCQTELNVEQYFLTRLSGISWNTEFKVQSELWG